MNDQEAIAKAKADLSWIQKHERILALALVLLVAAFGFNKWVNHEATVKHEQAIVATEVAKQAQAEADAKRAESTLEKAKYESDTLERQREFQSLLAAIAQRDKASEVKVAEVTKPKTPPEAVKDIEELYNVHDIVPTDTGAIVPTGDLQLFSATKIAADTCREDLVDTQKALTSAQAGEAQAQGVIAGQQKALDASRAALDAEKTSHKNDVDDLKAQARKSKRNWFIAGYVAGFISGAATAIAAHL